MQQVAHITVVVPCSRHPRRLEHNVIVGVSY
jgi:hypothetical protein